MCTCDSLIGFVETIKISDNDKKFFSDVFYKDINYSLMDEIESKIKNLPNETSKLNKGKAWGIIGNYTREVYSYTLSQPHIDTPYHEHSLFYRGQSNIDYRNKLAPGIYRSTEKHDEHYYFHEMQVRCPSIFSSMKNINKLTYMQHYGCPTRLLDITSNPLVALYFACCDHQNDKDGIVFVFGTRTDEILYEESDRVQMLSKFCELKPNEQEQLMICSYINLLKGNFKKNSAIRYIDNEVERFYHAIKRDNGAFEREIVPLDLLRPIFVQTNKDNPRILKQDGAFILCGLDLNEADSNYKIKKQVIKEIVIPAYAKAKILKELEQICINQATLFPEVDKVADYLKHR